MHWIKTAGGAVAATVRGVTYSVAPDHANYACVLKALKAGDEETFVKCANVREALSFFVEGRVTIKEDRLIFQGHPVPNDRLTQRLLEYMKDGYSPVPFMRFLDRVRDNVRSHVNTRLFEFLENRSMPITPKGTFLGYKMVRDDFRDYYTGNFDYTPGKVVEMNPWEVDDDPHHDCSTGFHVGSWSYARTFKTSGKVLIVEVDPTWVITVPEDCNSQKLRAFKVRSLQVCRDQMNGAIYTNKANVEPLTQKALEAYLALEK